jgi:hypothetical protein
MAAGMARVSFGNAKRGRPALTAPVEGPVAAVGGGEARRIGPAGGLRGAGAIVRAGGSGADGVLEA